MLPSSGHFYKVLFLNCAVITMIHFLCSPYLKNYITSHFFFLVLLMPNSNHSQTKKIRNALLHFSGLIPRMLYPEWVTLIQLYMSDLHITFFSICTISVALENYLPQFYLQFWLLILSSHLCPFFFSRNFHILFSLCVFLLLSNHRLFVYYSLEEKFSFSFLILSWRTCSFLFLTKEWDPDFQNRCLDSFKEA